ncbi:helix-turn-helix domain-containing protein [Dactylosporangium sp. NPDC000244]|uniref:TetR/AcrR family transcriptional regulator n=1 Tax=Dactylosporangium sp. NPDC000244 TaxID=3154365 RepID=UPI003318915B
MAEAAANDNDEAQGRRRGRQETEAVLMRAALELLAREGVLAGLNLKDVADEAGVNRGLIHHYFGSRQTLLRNALDMEMHALAERVGMEAYVNPARRGARSFRAQADEMQLARVVMLLALDGDDELAPIPFYESSLEFLKDEQSRGIWDEDLDPRALLALWYSFLSGYLVLRPALARQLGLAVKTLDARVMSTIGRMWGPLWHEGDDTAAH